VPPSRVVTHGSGTCSQPLLHRFARIILQQPDPARYLGHHVIRKAQQGGRVDIHRGARIEASRADNTHRISKSLSVRSPGHEARQRDRIAPTSRIPPPPSVLFQSRASG